MLKNDGSKKQSEMSEVSAIPKRITEMMAHYGNNYGNKKWINLLLWIVTGKIAEMTEISAYRGGHIYFIHSGNYLLQRYQEVRS